jgi:hypothetical protein
MSFSQLKQCRAVAMPARTRMRVSTRAFATHLLFASCETGHVAGHLGVASDQPGALLFRGRRSGCLLDSC